MGFQTYIFCSKVSSKCRKCRFRDPNFKMGFQTYIFCSKEPSKCRKCRFRDPNFKKTRGDGACPRTPYNCVVTMASPTLKSWLRHCSLALPYARLMTFSQWDLWLTRSAALESGGSVFKILSTAHISMEWARSWIYVHNIDNIWHLHSLSTDRFFEVR